MTFDFEPQTDLRKYLAYDEDGEMFLQEGAPADVQREFEQFLEYLEEVENDDPYRFQPVLLEDEDEDGGDA